jgi:hypothetical protein
MIKTASTVGEKLCILTSLYLPSRRVVPPAQPVKTKPQLNAATKKALASSPSRVYSRAANINQSKTAYENKKCRHRVIVSW